MSRDPTIFEFISLPAAILAAMCISNPTASFVTLHLIGRPASSQLQLLFNHPLFSSAFGSSQPRSSSKHLRFDFPSLFAFTTSSFDSDPEEEPDEPIFSQFGLILILPLRFWTWCLFECLVFSVLRGPRWSSEAASIFKLLCEVLGRVRILGVCVGEYKQVVELIWMRQVRRTSVRTWLLWWARHQLVAESITRVQGSEGRQESLWRETGVISATVILMLQRTWKVRRITCWQKMGRVCKKVGLSSMIWWWSALHRRKIRIVVKRNRSGFRYGVLDVSKDLKVRRSSSSCLLCEGGKKCAKR